MSTTIEATYDDSVFRPTQPVGLTPNTTVRLTVETLPKVTEPPTSFLQTARALQLQGPPDWARNLDDYLYGEETGGGQ
jgi:predicted DNA-binding antitoxin AbrB/MazE fold protein